MPTAIELIGAILFAVALVHTFSTRFFEHLAHTRPAHAGLWHRLAEVEVVFGLWAMVLILFIFAIQGSDAAASYVDSRNFTEPMFVFAIVVIAGARFTAPSAARADRAGGRSRSARPASRDEAGAAVRAASHGRSPRPPSSAPCRPPGRIAGFRS